MRIATAQKAPTASPELAAVLRYARQQRRGDWFAYGECKRRLEALGLSSRDYDTAHRQITNILKI